MKLVRGSLFLRLVLFILFGNGVVLFVLMAVSYTNTREIILHDQENYYTTLAHSSALDINGSFFAAEKAVDEMALVFTGIRNNRERVIDLLGKMLRDNPHLYGSAAALAPDQDFGASQYQILYAWRTKKGIETIDRTAPESDYQSDWFYLPFYLKKPVWTDPYYDSEVGELMVTYSVPVFEQGKVIAVLTCDLTMVRIQSLLSKLELGRQGNAILVSRYGKFIIHPNLKWVLQETIHSLAESASSSEDRETLLDISRKIRSEDRGSFRFQQLAKVDLAWLYYETIPSTGWTVGFVIPERQILQPLCRQNRIMALLGIAGVVLLLLPAFLISRAVARPLGGLCDAAERLAGGDFEATLPRIKHADEIGRLISAFHNMRIDLQKYIANLAATTAEKEKIASELSIARDIQHSILPKLFPPFPERPGLDIYALLESAREVGGDLYDFALIDEDQLYLCIGDVSGKGVPASLFMAVGKTLLKSTIHSVQDPAEALSRVNNELSEGNESCHFITVFCGILDLSSNELTYANAGHNPPFIIGSENVSGLKVASCPPLGAFSGVEYQNEKIQLQAGDKILLYTDGVTEAMNAREEFFGEERFVSLLKSGSCRTTKHCIEMVHDAIREFAEGAEQSDDITMLCVSNGGQKAAVMEPDKPSEYESLVLINSQEEFPKLLSWLDSMSEKFKWSSELLMQMNLVLEEWLVNVISYAFEDDLEHEIEIKLWQDEQALFVEVSDGGKAFDPTMKEDPDLEQALEERAIGGLGIHLLKKYVDQVLYKRIADRNILTLIKQR